MSRELEAQITELERRMQAVLDNGGTRDHPAYKQNGMELGIAKGMLRAHQTRQQSSGVISSLVELGAQENAARINHDTEGLEAVREQMAAKVRELNQIETREFLKDE